MKPSDIESRTNGAARRISTTALVVTLILALMRATCGLFAGLAGFEVWLLFFFSAAIHVAADDARSDEVCEEGLSRRRFM